MLPLPIPNKVQ